MNRQVREPKVRKIKVAAPKVRQLEAEQVAAALGAEPAGVAISGNPGPLSLFQLRRDIFDQLRSQGGRPSLADAEMQKKIPMDPDSWNQLEALAESLSADLSRDSASRLRKVTASQVAARLLSLALREITHEKQEEDKHLLTTLREELHHP